ncbi:hypothetical protein MKW94_024173 [Papaver nudicaule]|uniref:Uncharacterized protein n=1 Tax=Papaver nudicaule TaxID=74823 RepID=A0AA41RVI3_PAPNU|nr:hypothetical protein [Papaver nudicaule]
MLQSMEIEITDQNLKTPPLSRSNSPIHNSSSNSSITDNFFTCEICIEPVLLSQKFNNMEMDGCVHPYCTDCIVKYIEVKVIHDNESEIKCPNSDCTVFLNPLSCQLILPVSTFEKWSRVLCESAVFMESSKGGFAYGRSYCPFRECSELVLNECFYHYKINCPNCKKIFCFHCMVPWKVNHGCTRRGGLVIDVDRNDLLFLEAARQENWTRCPNCGRYVERKIGCDFMMCRCKAIFCYRCGCMICKCKANKGYWVQVFFHVMSYVFYVLLGVGACIILWRIIAEYKEIMQFLR